MIDISDLKKEINAVVSRVTEETVIINCQLPSDMVKLSLPKNSVPESLASYGTPVSLSIETIGGYKQPVIKPRKIEKRQHVEKELHDIEDWLLTINCEVWV